MQWPCQWYGCSKVRLSTEYDRGIWYRPGYKDQRQGIYLSKFFTWCKNAILTVTHTLNFKPFLSVVRWIPIHCSITDLPD